jgi:ATP-dependent Zn protease
VSKKTRRNITPYIALVLVLIVIYFVSTMMSSKVHNMSYSTFMKNLKKDKVETVELSPNTKGSIYEITGRMKGYDSKESYYTTAPLTDDTVKTLNVYSYPHSYGFTGRLTL